MSSSKPRKIQFLQVLLSWVERNESRKVACQLLGITNQSLSYHLSKLRLKGIIEEVQHRPAIYKLTPLGIHIRETIAQSDVAMTDYYSCHHLIIGYEITDYGTWKFNEKLWKEMRGHWHWQKVRVRDFNVRIQTTGLMAIICPKRYGKNPNETFDKLIEEGKDIAKILANKYNMKLGDYKRIREGHKELLGSNKIAELIGYWKQGGVWIDASGGSMNFEENQDETKIENLLDVPNRIDKIEETLSNKLTPAIIDLTNQLQLHLSVESKQDKNMDKMNIVLQEISNGIKELRDVMKK